MKFPFFALLSASFRLRRINQHGGALCHVTCGTKFFHQMRTVLPTCTIAVSMEPTFAAMIQGREKIILIAESGLPIDSNNWLQST
jgi:hypothetical protein